MSRPKEVYKEWYPEQFSDSVIIREAEIDRNFFDYFLSTISSKSMEKDFEHFCQKIIEREVCPNLLSQTGPTGGGDSKVDSETYPVSEEITQTWFYGYGDRAGSERWAFAFSAKKSGEVKLSQM